MAMARMQSSRTGTCESERAGFTLVELVVVLGIVALTLVYVAPKLAGGETGELKGSARRLLYTARRLSDEALYTKDKRVLTLDLEHREYWEGDGRTKSRLPNQVFIRSVTIGGEQVTQGVVALTYYPSGLRDEASVTLSGRGPQAYTVVIPALGERFEVRDE